MIVACRHLTLSKRKLVVGRWWPCRPEKEAAAFHLVCYEFIGPTETTYLVPFKVRKSVIIFGGNPLPGFLINV